MIAEQQKRVTELERRLGMNSGNSSLPPSSDRPNQKPEKSTRQPSQRRRGGQQGHAKRSRPLIPTEECDRVVQHRPRACTRCGTKLSGTDPDPDRHDRHQVTDLPAVKPTVTEHQIHTLGCPGCGCQCRGTPPPDVPRGCFGPNVVAVVTLLSSVGRLSQRMIASLLQDLFDLKISDGQISRLQSVGRKALQAGFNEIAADVRSSAVVNIDETGWRENGSKAWLWTLVGHVSTLFAVCASRSRSALRELLGDEFSGAIVSDRYSAYSHFEDDRHQFCWSHLLRDFQAMIDRGGDSAEFGKRLKTAGQKLIQHWNRFRAGKIARGTLDGGRDRSSALSAG